MFGSEPPVVVDLAQPERVGAHGEHVVRCGLRNPVQAQVGHQRVPPIIRRNREGYADLVANRGIDGGRGKRVGQDQAIFQAWLDCVGSRLDRGHIDGDARYTVRALTVDDAVDFDRNRIAFRVRCEETRK